LEIYIDIYLIYLKYLSLFYIMACSNAGLQGPLPCMTTNIFIGSRSGIQQPLESAY